MRPWRRDEQHHSIALLVAPNASPRKRKKKTPSQLVWRHCTLFLIAAATTSFLLQHHVRWIKDTPTAATNRRTPTTATQAGARLPVLVQPDDRNSMVASSLSSFVAADATASTSRMLVDPPEGSCTISSEDTEHLYSSTSTTTLYNIHKVPTFIIAGAQKSGTTALFMMLRQHPHLLSTTKMEAHFFDRVVIPESPPELCRLRHEYLDLFTAQRILARQERLQKARRCDKNCTVFTFEKTPSYLCLDQVPEYIHRITPWAKVVIVLRNPIDRAMSQFRMQQTALQLYDRQSGTSGGSSMDRIGMGTTTMSSTFDDMVTEEIRRLRLLHLTQAPGLPMYKYAVKKASANDANATAAVSMDAHIQRLCRQRNMTCTFRTTTTGTNGSTLQDRLEQRMPQVLPHVDHRRRIQCSCLARGMYAQQLAPWLRYFALNQTLLVVQYERFVHNRVAVLSEVLNFVGAPPFSGNLVPEPNKVTKLERTSGELTRSAAAAAAAETVPTFLSKSYSPYHRHNLGDSTHGSSTGSSTVPEGVLNGTTRDYLRRFYGPYNDELADLLGEEWRNVWANS
jgi:Sulfotransferase family